MHRDGSYLVDQPKYPWLFPRVVTSPQRGNVRNPPTIPIFFTVEMDIIVDTGHTIEAEHHSIYMCSETAHCIDGESYRG